MGKRKSLSKKVRFDVFKRDGFVCQYCGNNPPSVTLEVDHIQPVSAGGGNDPDNLLTSCFDCNRGKGADVLTNCPETVAQKARLLTEKEDQIKAFKKLQSAIKRRLTSETNKVEAVFQESFPGFCFNDRFKISVKQFLQRLPYYEVEEAMEIACGRIDDGEQANKYFCGICWRKIKDQSERIEGNQ